MSFITKSVALVVLAGGFVTLLPGTAAADLDSRYSIREGDETITLDHVMNDPTTGCEVYSLNCGGIFTQSSGRLVYDPTTDEVWVKVKVVRDFMGLALRGTGDGKVGPGGSIVINGLKLDGRTKQLHFD